MRAYRVWFKDDSAVLVHAETPAQAKDKAQEVADRNNGIRPLDRWEAARFDKATTIRSVEPLGNKIAR